MMSREQLAMSCIEKLERDGHKLFGCHCGRVHVEPVMGIVSPTGYTVRELVIMYVSCPLAVLALFLTLWWLGF